MARKSAEANGTRSDARAGNDLIRSMDRAPCGLTETEIDNALAVAGVPMLFLTADLRLRRFTPAAATGLRLAAPDLGRRVEELAATSELGELTELTIRAISTGALVKKRIRDRRGRCRSVRVGPYRMPDGRIDGAVVALPDDEELESGRDPFETSRDFADEVVATIQEGLVIFDAELRIQTANRAFHEMFRLEEIETKGVALHELQRGSWNVPELIDLLREAVSGRLRVGETEVEIGLPALGPRVVAVTARRCERERLSHLVLAALSDVTRRKAAERIVHELPGRLLQARDDEQRRLAQELHDTTSQNLAALAMNLSAVRHESRLLSAGARSALAESVELADECSREVRDVAALLHPPFLEELGLVSAIQWHLESFVRRSGIRVTLDVMPAAERLERELEIAVFRIVQECLTNVHKHSASPVAEVRIERALPAELRVVVRDAGRGMPAITPDLADGNPMRGVGIPGMRERTRRLGGRLDVTSDANGTTITATLPLTSTRKRPMVA